ncbi:MAG TPA: hypothetical protein VFI65_20695, partial [Streptosporangiaceae bacterium]|nr:hypothetical protein [Streptosporangiaceae bacterium]
MTAVSAAPAGRAEPARVAAELLRWRGLTWVTWRQRRTSLLVMTGLFALTAVFMAVDSLVTRHQLAAVRLELRSGLLAYSLDRYLVLGALELLPVLAGLLLGAPLVAGEAEKGTARFAWTQRTGRGSWLLAQVIPVAAGLAIAAVALGLEFAWWWRPYQVQGTWGGWRFNLNPLPYAGWMVLGFAVGVLIGALVRRTVPALTLTFVGYAALLYAVSASWRLHYLAPLRQPDLWVKITSGGSYAVFESASNGVGRYELNSYLGWPDGRPLSYFDRLRQDSWFAAHHVELWTTYQP